MSDAALVDLATDTLDALVAHWPAPNTALDLPHLAPLPKRRYVMLGAPTADCEQVVVSLDRVFGAGGGNLAQERIIPLSEGIPWLQTAVFAIQILRCVTGPKDRVPPKPETLTTETLTQLTDADAVVNVLIEAQAAGELAGCGGLALEGWRAITASGGVAGGTTRVRLNLF